MKVRRKLILVLALVLSVAMVTTGTLAYLTDRDSEVNVFTFGNVKIQLNEKFEQEAELIPNVHVEKNVSITNTGKNDAWVWYTIAYPKTIDLTASGKTILWTGFETQNHDNVGYEGAKDSEAEWLIEWTKEPYLKYFTDEDGTEMVQFTVLYQQKLASGATTPISLKEVYLDKSIDIAPEGNLYRVENGVTEKIDWNVNANGYPTIYVSAYAIQAVTFDTVQEAYAAYNVQWGENGTEYGGPTRAVSTSDELIAALETITEDDESVTVVLLNDIDATRGVNVTGNVVLDLNGYKLSSRTGDVQVLLWARPGSKLTITGDGEVYSENHNEWMLYTNAGAEIVVENGRFVKAPYVWGAECEYEGCTGGGSHTINAQNLRPLLCGPGIITIYDGYFDCGILNPDYVEEHSKPVVHDCMYPTINLGIGDGDDHIVIYGGTFVTANPVDGDDNPAKEDGESDNTKGNTLATEKAFFLYGQESYGVLPDGYDEPVVGKTEDGRTTYTYHYNFN